MALTRRAVAVTLAALTIAGAAAQPAQAYWSGTGRGTGTVPTVAEVLTLQLTMVAAGSSGKNSVKASGQAGSGSPYDSTITVVLCKANSFPCTSANGAITLTASVTGGTYSVTSSPLNNGWSTVYGQARQSQGPRWASLSLASVGTV